MGFSQSTPKLKFLVVMTLAERKRLGVMLLQLRQNFTKSMEKLYITGELKIEPGHFVLKRALAPLVPLCPLSLPPWVPCSPSLPSGPLLPLQANFRRASDFLQSFLITCPHCTCSRAFNGLPLRKKCWTQIRCTACQTTLPSHRWFCPCGISWRSCPEHSRWPDYATLHAKRSLKHHRLARRTKGDAAESSSFLQQVHNTRNCQTFNLDSDSGSIHNSSTSTACLIHVSNETMLRPPKRKAASISMGYLQKCPKLLMRFGHLAAGQ